MGQMVRGGRSWPSDRNVGAGAERSGKDCEVSASGALRPTDVLGIEGLEHDEEQMLHLSCAPLPWSCCEWSCAT